MLLQRRARGGRIAEPEGLDRLAPEPALFHKIAPSLGPADPPAALRKRDRRLQHRRQALPLIVDLLVAALGLGSVTPASAASRSTASETSDPRLDQNAEDVAVLARREAVVEAFWSLTKNDGVFSILKGDSPTTRALLLQGNFRPTTWLTGRRARISSSR